MEFQKPNVENAIKLWGGKTLEEVVCKLQRNYYGPRYVGASLSEMEIPDSEAIKAVEFMEKPKNMLLYHGSPGCGKTRFCAALTEWAVTNFMSFRKYRELDLLSKLRSSMGEKNADYSLILDQMIDDDLIILDDVGSGINPDKVSYKDLEWRREIFFNFLDNRYNSMKPTIITSNFSRKEFNDVYSDRIESRLFSSENKFISIFGSEWDQRQKGR